MCHPGKWGTKLRRRAAGDGSRWIDWDPTGLHGGYMDRRMHKGLQRKSPQPLDFIGAGCRTRTRHLMITNQLLYLMS